MKRTRYLATIFTILGLFSNLNGAVTVNLLFNAGAGYFVRADGSSNLDVTGVLQYGVFNSDAFALLSPAQQQQASVVSTLFTSYGSQNFDSSGYITAFINDETDGTQGDQLSVFVSQGNEFGVFSSTSVLWDYPADLGSATLSPATSDVAYVGSINSGSPNTLQLITSVPEPASLGLVFALMTLVFVRFRKRNRSDS